MFETYQLLNSGYDQFYSYAAADQGDEVKALSETAKWLQDQPKIKSVYITDDTYLVAELQNGLQFQLIVNYVDQDGKSLYRGGKHGTGQIMRVAGTPQCPHSMPNKKILLWAPRYTEFNLDQEYPLVEEALNKSEVHFDIHILKDEECTPASMKTFGQYGVVMIDTHGHENSMLLGDLALKKKLESAAEFKKAVIAYLGSDSYDMFTNGGLILSKQILVATSSDWWTDASHKIDDGHYQTWASSKFIKTLGGLSNTVIFNNSCYSGALKFNKNAKDAEGNIVMPGGVTVANAFLGNSPIAYYGWRYDDGTSTGVDCITALVTDDEFAGTSPKTTKRESGTWSPDGSPIADDENPAYTNPDLKLHLDNHDDYCYDKDQNQDVFTVALEGHVNVKDGHASNPYFTAEFAERKDAKSYSIRLIKKDGTKGPPNNRLPSQLSIKDGKITWGFTIGSVFIKDGLSEGQMAEETARQQKMLDDYTGTAIEVTVNY